MLWSVFVGILFLIFGVLIFLKPDWVWKLTEQWKSYCADEPSDFYIKTTKMGGIIYILLGIAMMIVPLILE